MKYASVQISLKYKILSYAFQQSIEIQKGKEEEEDKKEKKEKKEKKKGTRTKNRKRKYNDGCVCFASKCLKLNEQNNFHFSVFIKTNTI